MSLVIIACSFCSILILNYKYTKCRRDYQLFLNSSYPELTYLCKHLTHLFPGRVSYNCFVELEKEVLLQLTIFIKEVFLDTCTGISFVDSTPLRVCRNQCILIYKNI